MQRTSRRILIALSGYLAIFVMVTIAPDEVFIRLLAASRPVIQQTRGLQKPGDEVIQELSQLKEQSIEVYRRLDAIEKEKYDSRLAVLDSKVDTIFEFGRIVLGAAVLYIVQFIAGVVTWAAKKSNVDIRPSDEAL